MLFLDLKNIDGAREEMLGGKYFQPRHWYQFADDAAVISGQQNENQVLLNAFTRWSSWADMLIESINARRLG